MVAKNMKAELACVDCGQITPRRSANQKYCPNCRAERACATEHQLLKLIERRHAPVDWVEVDQQLSVLLGRCDLLFHNQAMFVRDVHDRRERAKREGVDYYLSVAQRAWLDGLHHKVTARMAVEEDVRRQQQMAKLEHQGESTIH
jgi:hypothetical protein